MALLGVTAALASTSYAAGSYGYDISYPQGNGPYPSPPASITFSFGIVGVTGGKAFITNASLSEEYGWVTNNGQAPSLYMNLNYPVGSTASQGKTGPAGNCSKGDKSCQAYNYGYNAAQSAFTYAGSVTATASTWWLDIETANSWSPNTTYNDRVIQGAIDYLNSKGLTVGIYSSASMWNKIAGKSYSPALPLWITGAPSLTGMPAYCSSAKTFGGGTTELVQYWNGSYDVDYACQ